LLPAEMFGSLSKREKDQIFNKHLVTQPTNKKEESDSDPESKKWDTELDLAKEKSKAFDVLAKLVP